MQVKRGLTGKISGGFIMLLGVFFLGLLLSRCSLKPKVYHVGILTSFTPMISIADSFKSGMKGLGYIEGKNIIYVRK